MKKPPFYEWIPDKHPEADTMTPDVFGCYHRLFEYYVKKRELPSDLLELAAICRYSPAPEFGKVWKKLAPHLGGKGLKWLNVQLKIDEEYREKQAIKGKLLQDKKKRMQPEYSHGLTEIQPESPKLQVIVNPDQPNCSQKKAVAEPEISQEQIGNELETKPLAVAKPELSQIEAESEPEITEKEIDDFMISNGYPPGIPKIFLEEKLNVPEVNFDQEAGWKAFAPLYPEFGIVHKEEAKDAFKKEIVSRNLYWRLRRALGRYRDTITTDQDVKTLPFMEWFKVWEKWEDAK